MILKALRFKIYNKILKEGARGGKEKTKRDN